MTPQQRLQRVIAKHRLPTFIVGVIMIALGMTAVSMHLYRASGAYTLDLSRPEYEAVRQDIKEERRAEDQFPASGEVTPAVMRDFLERYEKEADQVLSAQPFGNDVLSDEQLGLMDAG